MESFSDVYNEYFALSKYDLAKKMFEAGQQSKQAEVDGLQERIDDALSFVEDTHSENWQDCISCINNILKGDNHE